MIGFFRKMQGPQNAPQSAEAVNAAEAEAAPPVAPSEHPDDIAESLEESLRMLELATLALDGIAARLGEARMLARIARRPEGASQRGLIAARYAVLKEDIESRAAEAALASGDSIALLIGGEEGRQGSLMTRSLPRAEFRTSEEARALSQTMERALRAVEEEAERIRDAAGEIADSLAREARMAKAKPAPAKAPADAETARQVPIARPAEAKRRAAA